ncbi:hypothetical protein LCGC14_3006300, partial [marine sediment metagenome]
EFIRRLKEGIDPDDWDIKKNGLKWERGFRRAMLLIKMDIDKVSGFKDA